MRGARIFTAFLLVSLTLANGAAYGPEPFWIAKPFARWTVEECQQMLRQSPWTRIETRNLVSSQNQMTLRVTFHSAEPILLARAALKQYLPNEIPDRVRWGQPFLYAGPLDIARARRYIEEISYPEDVVVVQVIGGFGWWSRFDELTPDDLTEWTFLRIKMSDREIELKAKSYVRPSQSPTYEALFLFDRPEGVRPPGSIEFVTELPTRRDWTKSRRFHVRMKVKFKLEEMLFNYRLVF